MNGRKVDVGQKEVRTPARRPLVIVIADDDRDTVLTLITLLRDEGHTVHGVYKGDDVMPIVRKVRPDAVILDISMPGQSGFSVAQDIRANYYGVRKPLLIAVTGLYKGASDRLLSEMVSFDHHLAKPYDPLALIGLLNPLTLPPELA